MRPDREESHVVRSWTSATCMAHGQPIDQSGALRTTYDLKRPFDFELNSTTRAELLQPSDETQLLQQSLSPVTSRARNLLQVFK
mmetsp:Transcript_40041/g.86452  ORF Transcript_40041/g.86452 Transcript_40041/m.86452 type:complete len:84 (-) Transcript_40041:139-390(-)